MTDLELAWLAGLLEGEGSFLRPPPSDLKRPRISIEMTDEDVMQRVADLVGLKLVRPRIRQVHWKPSFRLAIRGPKAVDLMKRLYPLMGKRRQEQIDQALS